MLTGSTVFADRLHTRSHACFLPFPIMCQRTSSSAHPRVGRQRYHIAFVCVNTVPAQTTSALFRRIPRVTDGPPAVSLSPAPRLPVERLRDEPAASVNLPLCDNSVKPTARPISTATECVPQCSARPAGAAAAAGAAVDHTQPSSLRFSASSADSFSLMRASIEVISSMISLSPSAAAST